MKKFKKIACLLALCCLLNACGAAQKKAGARPAFSSDNVAQLQTPAEGASIAIITTTLGEIRAVLFDAYTPMAVENFMGLAQRGYYNNTTFHRIVPDFIVQGGDATASGSGGASIWNDTPFPTELSAQLHHFSGALCMAQPDGSTNGNLSQFYILQTPATNIDRATATALAAQGLSEAYATAYREVGGAPYLDGTDTVFGQVYRGMEIVDAIAAVQCDENGTPLEPVSVLQITISTYSAEAQAALDTAASQNE